VNLNFTLAIPGRDWKIPCALCEKDIEDGEEGIEIEKQFLAKGFQDDTLFRLLRVWHKDCFNQYLEKDEE